MTEQNSSKWADKIRACPAVWIISDRDSAFPDYQQGEGRVLDTTDSFRVPRQFGFQVVERWQFRQTQLTKLVR